MGTATKTLTWRKPGIPTTATGQRQLHICPTHSCHYLPTRRNSVGSGPPKPSSAIVPMVSCQRAWRWMVRGRCSRRQPSSQLDAMGTAMCHSFLVVNTMRARLLEDTTARIWIRIVGRRTWSQVARRVPLSTRTGCPSRRRPHFSLCHQSPPVDRHYRRAAAAAAATAAATAVVPPAVTALRHRPS